MFKHFGLTLVVFIFSLCVISSIANGGTFSSELESLVKDIMDVNVDSGKCYLMKDVRLEKDGMTIIFKDGKFYPLKPVKGMTTGGVYVGTGEIIYQPAEKIEQNELLFFSKSNHLIQKFTEAYFRFNDGTEEIIAATGTVVSKGGSDLSAVQAIVSQKASDQRKAWEVRNKTPTDMLQKNTVYTYLDNYILHSIYGTGLPFNRFFEADVKTEDFEWLHISLDYNLRQELTLGKFILYENYFDTWVNEHCREDLKKKYTERYEDKDYFTVDNYRIDITVKQFVPEVEAVADLEIKSRVESLSLVNLFLKNTLNVISVTIDGNACEVGRIKDDEAFYVLLPQPLQKGASVRLSVKYDGHFDPGPYRFFRGNDGWFPINRGTYSRSNYEIKLTMHKDFQALCSLGEPLSYKVNGYKPEFIWKSETPSRPPDILTGDYRSEVSESEEFKLRFWDRKGTKISGFESKKVTKTLTVLEKILGECPRDFFNVLNWSSNYVNDNLIVLREGGTYFYDLSLLWWSDMHWCSPYSYDRWLINGLNRISDWEASRFSDFGQFCLKVKYGNTDNFWDPVVKEGRPVILGNRLFYHKNKDKKYGSYIAYKGSYILYMLKNTVGDDKFCTLLREFHKRYNGKKVSYRDFESLTSEICQGNFGWFFDQWVRGSEIPEVRFIYSINDNPEGGYLLDGKIEQVNTEFIFVAGIYFTVNNDEFVNRQLVKHKEHNFQLKLDAKPSKVEFNRNLELLCKAVQ